MKEECRQVPAGLPISGESKEGQIIRISFFPSTNLSFIPLPVYIATFSSIKLI
jgi:hypothetical protein